MKCLPVDQMKQSNTMQQLVIVILGTLQSSSINDLIKIIASHSCHMIDCRISVLGQECAANLLISGNWSAIAKLEAHIPALEKKLGLNIQHRRTQQSSVDILSLPYSIYITALDSPDITHKITQFLSDENIPINHLTVSAYAAPYTQAPMLTISISINIPITAHIADVRERFLLFCDDLNLDVIIEPQKN